MKTLPPDRYTVTMTDCEILHLPIINQRRKAVISHRCLNYTLIVSDGAHTGCKITGCIPLDNTQGRYAPIVQFFRQIGWFRDPEDFDENELKDRIYHTETGILFDKHLGLRSYVIRFFPSAS